MHWYGDNALWPFGPGELINTVESTFVQNLQQTAEDDTSTLDGGRVWVGERQRHIVSQSRGGEDRLGCSLNKGRS